MTSLTDYICINHHLMTVMEMEQETGAKADTIRGIMKRNGWELFSPVDRVREYIVAHPGSVVEDIAEKFDAGVAYVSRLAKEAGVELTTRFQVEGKKEKPEKKEPVRYSLMHRAFNDSDPEGLKEDLEIILGPEKPVKRVKEAYNQSGSPFGLADKVKDIKLK